MIETYLPFLFKRTRLPTAPTTKTIGATMRDIIKEAALKISNTCFKFSKVIAKP